MGRSEMLCDCDVIHEDIVEYAKSNMPDAKKISNLTALFKVYGDSTRMRIISALRIHEMCVCDISVLLNMTKSAVSHQLRILRDNGVVAQRRSGKVVYYSLHDDHIESILDIANIHIDHMEEENEKNI